MNVADYMNPTLVYLRAGDRPGVAQAPMAEFGLTAVPVLDTDHRPTGLVTLGRPERLVTIERTATLAVAAQQMLESNVHHLVVVDAQGTALGMLSSLDIIRGLVGVPAKHPDSIRRFIAVTDIAQKRETAP